MSSNRVRVAALCVAGTLLAATSACIDSGSQAQAMMSQPSVEESNKQIVAAAFERWAAGGTSFFDDVLASDVVWTIKGSSPSAGTFTGRENFVERAVRPFVSRLSTPVRPVSQRVWADGDHVIINWDGEAVARDGGAYRNSYVWIFRMRAGKAAEVTAFLDLAPYDDVLRRIPASPDQEQVKMTTQQHPYIGMWVTADGRIRQELLPSGRYDEARGSQKSAYQGRYEVKGNHIDYWDDTGFTADGTFVSPNELHHGGMIFFREAL